MIYLDANATSRLRASAVEAMTSLMREEVVARNPSSVHQPGQRARGLINTARKQILSLVFPEGETKINARVIFTSGGTEACNLMVKGFIGNIPGHIVSSEIEHPAIIETIQNLCQAGSTVTFVSPRGYQEERRGIVCSTKTLEAVTKKTALVVLMYANNETGAIQPIARITKKIREAGYQPAIVCDLTQAYGKIPVDLKELFDLGVDAVAISAHKIGGPAGVGALIIKTDSHNSLCHSFYPQMVGGPQELRFRAGTENLLGIVGFGYAVNELKQNFSEYLIKTAELKESFWNELVSELPDLEKISPEESLANTLLVRFPDLRGDDLVVALDLAGVCASNGSACASGKPDISHVLKAMGYDKTQAREAVRFSLDWDADQEMVSEAVRTIVTTVQRMSNSIKSEKVSNA